MIEITKLFRTIRDFIINPRIVYKIALQKKLKCLLVTTILIMLLIIFEEYKSITSMNELDYHLESGSLMRLKLLIPLSPLIYICPYAIVGLLLNFISKIFDGKGNYSDTITILWIPALINLLLREKTFLFLTFQLNIVIVIWLIVLIVIGLSEAHKFSVAKSVTVIIIVFIILFSYCKINPEGIKNFFIYFL